MAKDIVLTRGQVTLVDDEDFEWLNSMKWQATWAEHTQSYYARRSFGLKPNRKTIRMHAVITGFALTDHINNNTLDNRRSNLREVTYQQNGCNQRLRKDNKTGFKGVQKVGNKYKASIRVNYVPIHLGTFDTAEEAYAVYCAAAIHYFGEFANVG